MKQRKGVSALLAVLGLVIVTSITLMGASDDETVVITRPGVVFHKAGSADLHGRGVERSLSQAQASGYQPCRICFGKTTSLTTDRNGLLTGMSGRVSTTNGVSLPPGLGRMTASPVQPNGTKSGSLYGGGHHGEGVRDPFDAPRTITRPAKDQGAYGPVRD